MCTRTPEGGSGVISLRCQQCGESFTCGSKGESCWCGDLPRLYPPDPALSCVCRDCLVGRIRSSIAEFVAGVTPATAIAASERAQRYSTDGELLEGIDYELDGGQFVLSAWYLLKRGSCCENGCRNCPYGYVR